MLRSQINCLVILTEVEGDEVVNTMTDVANHDEVNRIYQVLLYFKNVMKGLTCTNFHETCKYSTALKVDILYNNKSKHIKDKLFI